MSADADNILAAINGGGAAGNALANFGKIGMAAPTDTDTPLSSPTNESQTVTITGTPAGGTFTLTYAGQTTAGIAYNAIASAVKTALEALSNVDSVTVTGGPGPGTPWVVVFGGDLADEDVAQMTASGASLTGGSSPAVAVTTTTPGVGGWFTAGWCSENGLSGKFAVSSTDIPAFGTFQPVRTIITQAKQTFDVEFLESNPISLAIYHGFDLTHLVPDTAGAFNFATGRASTEQYAGVFDMVDGDNAIRAFCPKLQVTDKGDFTEKSGAPVSYPVTLTAFPDTDGNSVYWFYKVAALAS